MTYITQNTHTPTNEYYLGYGSDCDRGSLYVRLASGGYTLISYSVDNGVFNILLVEFKADFDKIVFKPKQEPCQVSKLDVVPLLSAVRNKILQL